MTWLALLSAREGRRAGLLAVAGISLGLALLAVAAATGVAGLITAYPIISEGLRWAGVIFLLYLAFDTWRDEPASAGTEDIHRPFRRGFIVNLLNPKAATVFIVLIPAAAGADTGLLPIVMLSLVYLLIATVVHALIVIFAGAFRQALINPRRERSVRHIFALALVGVALWFALSP
jgi:threonine/homoserine/homoserine lactone efflux protein